MDSPAAGTYVAQNACPHPPHSALTRPSSVSASVSLTYAFKLGFPHPRAAHRCSGSFGWLGGV